jgi:hypothetical protein
MKLLSPSAFALARSSGAAQGWVVPNLKDPPLKADAFCPFQEGTFRRVSIKSRAYSNLIRKWGRNLHVGPPQRELLDSPCEGGGLGCRMKSSSL